MELNDLVLDVTQSVEISADADKVFEAMLYRMGEGNTRLDGTDLDLRIEPWAGGRWFREVNGAQYLWGHVQVIKRPALLELSGPLFMSYPATNHVEVKVEPIDGGSRVTLRHRAIGMIDAAHREGVTHGWKHMIDAIKSDLEKAEAAG